MEVGTINIQVYLINGLIVKIPPFQNLVDKFTKSNKLLFKTRKTTNNNQDNQVHLYHYSQIVKKHLKQHHRTLQSLVKSRNWLVANRRNNLFLEQLEMSDNPQQDKEIYFQNADVLNRGNLLHQKKSRTKNIISLGQKLIKPLLTMKL
jgi:hypothetical protein